MCKTVKQYTSTIIYYDIISTEEDENTFSYGVKSYFQGEENSTDKTKFNMIQKLTSSFDDINSFVCFLCEQHILPIHLQDCAYDYFDMQ